MRIRLDGKKPGAMLPGALVTLTVVAAVLSGVLPLVWVLVLGAALAATSLVVAGAALCALAVGGLSAVTDS